MKIFFEALDTLDELNFGLTTHLSQYPCVSIKLGASNIHTLVKTCRFKLAFGRKFGNLKPSLIDIPIDGRIKLAVSANMAAFYEKYFSTYDVLHLNNCYTPYFKFIKQVCVPKILTFHDHMIANEDSKEKLSFLSKAFLQMDFVTVPSRFIANVMKKKTGCAPQVIYHGVNTNLFNTSITKFSARNYIGLPQKNKIVFWNARLDPEKNLETLITAMPHVLKKMPSALFLVKCGSSEKQSYREHLIRNYISKIEKNNPNVIFVFNRIPQEKLPCYYRASDVFVHTSRLESFGLVLAEAMACNLPVIAANSSCCPEIVDKGGMFFEPNNSIDLAEKILKILTDATLSEELGIQARLRILEHFTWSKAAQKYFELYSSLK